MKVEKSEKQSAAAMTEWAQANRTVFNELWRRAVYEDNDECALTVINWLTDRLDAKAAEEAPQES